MWKITPTHPVRYSLRSSSKKQSKQSQFNLQINPLPPFFPLTLKWWNNFSLLADFSQTTIEHQISHFIWRRQMKQFVESLNLNTQTNTHTHKKIINRDTNFYWHKPPPEKKQQHFRSEWRSIASHRGKSFSGLPNACAFPGGENLHTGGAVVARESWLYSTLNSLLRDFNQFIYLHFFER